MTLTEGVDFEEGLGTSEEWTELIDRGGLLCIRENTFHLFCALEEVQLQLKSLSGQTSSRKMEMINIISASDNVKFYWLIVTADFKIKDTNIHDMLLEEIIELYLKIRGFSYASMWLEKKTTQRSKGLR